MRNLQTVRDIYQAFGRGDIPAILEFLHPEVDWDNELDTQSVPWLTHRQGRAGVQAFFEAVGGLDIQRFEPLSFMSNENQVFATITVEAVVRATGRRIKDLEGHMFTFDDRGYVTRFRHFVDTHQHVMALRG